MEKLKVLMGKKKKKKSKKVSQADLFSWQRDMKHWVKLPVSSGLMQLAARGRWQLEATSLCVTDASLSAKTLYTCGGHADA